MSTNWDISTDIYNIRRTVENLKQRFVDEDEETLSLGMFGFIGDLEAKKIQVATIMTGQLGNEMFPTRAQLSKNVLVHAIYQNITDINARPAEIVVQLAIQIGDFEHYMKDGKFVFDRRCAIFIGNYEFHLDYDVILQRTQTSSMSEPVYSARYDMSHHNPISPITVPYLQQPFKVNMMNETWIIFSVTVRQTTIEWTEFSLVSDSVIDNKTFTFNFHNQLSGFYVYVTENNRTVRLTPYFFGTPVKETEENYCRYLFVNNETVRVYFDTLSYRPGLNAQIQVESYTTLGSSGNFLHSGDIDKKLDFVHFYSEEYGYQNVRCYCVIQSNSRDGRDQRSTEELRRLTPKFALSRGFLTTETDLNNYFNLINTETNRLQLQKKVDNQLERIWYAYFLIKDEFNNIIPTNTLKIQMDSTWDICYSCEDGRVVLPAGTLFTYNRSDGICRLANIDEIPEYYSDAYFNGDTYYYMTVYNSIINPDPLYAAFYMTTVNRDGFFIYDWVNNNCELQFIANRNNIRRKLLSEKNIYRFTFSIQQSVIANYGMYIEEVTEDNVLLVTNKMKCIMILYREGEPYRYSEGRLTEFDAKQYISNWEFVWETDNSLDNDNYLKLLNLGVIGSTDCNYGYFEDQFSAKLYILADFGQEYGRYNLDKMVPGLEGYTLTNIYEVDEGITVYKNYTNLMNTKVDALSGTNFLLSGIPLVGAHYMEDEDHVMYFMDSLDEKKIYIDNCLKIVENSFDIDLKFFNTYGPSVTYSIGDRQETEIGHVDLTMKFRMSLISASDIYAADDITQFIKEYIEDINDIGNCHINNMIADVRETFKNRINWFEYMNFNQFWLGVNHMILRNIEDPHTVPEFLNIRNQYDAEGNLVPCIEIENVKYHIEKT